eukprot:8005290-Pyramimonas_sp.AAC.1
MAVRKYTRRILTQATEYATTIIASCARQRVIGKRSGVTCDTVERRKRVHPRRLVSSRRRRLSDVALTFGSRVTFLRPKSNS